MRNTVFFGNGLNRISDNSVSWNKLLDDLKAGKLFTNKTLPNTMVYERIFMEKHTLERGSKADELEIKQHIANAMQLQRSNELFNVLAMMDFDHYLTTNYDYAFEEAIDHKPEKLSSEEIYSLRRKRLYKTDHGAKFLWNIHGEIDHPKSIMLGLDHYCGSVSKIDSYVKGTYTHTVKGESKEVLPMIKKLESGNYCYTSWVDLFFSSNLHIIGFSLDYSETDIWWILNKRARFAANGLINNQIYFYVNDIDLEKEGLLKSFGVNVVTIKLSNNDYKGMYKTMINSMPL